MQNKFIEVIENWSQENWGSGKKIFFLQKKPYI